MKKWIVRLLFVIMIFGLTGCGLFGNNTDEVRQITVEVVDETASLIITKEIQISKGQDFIAALELDETIALIVETSNTTMQIVEVANKRIDAYINATWNVFKNGVAADISSLSVANNDVLRFVLVEDIPITQIQVVVTTLDGNRIIEKEIGVPTNRTLVHVLMQDSEVLLITEDSTWGAFVSSVAGIAANDFAYAYWAIYINDEFSLVGIEEIVLEEGDVLSFVLTSWYTPTFTTNTIVVIDLEGNTLVEEEIVVFEEETLIAVLRASLSISLITEESTWGAFVASVAGIHADDFDFAYWAIYVNGEFSLVGIEEISLEEGDVLSFVLTSWYTPIEDAEVVIDSTLRVEETKQIELIINPGYATILTLQFTSSDESILMVSDTGVITGVRRGQAEVTIALNDLIFTVDIDVKNKRLADLTNEELDALSDEELLEIFEEAYLEEVAEKEAQQLAFVDTLEDLIPSTTTTNIALPQTTGIPNVFIFWTSSNPSTIDVSGNVSRKRADQEVTLVATVRNSYQTLTILFEKTILVKGFEMPELAEKNLTFAYLMNGSFQGIRAEDLKKIDVINLAFAYINVNAHTLNVAPLSHLNQIMKVRESGVRVVLSIGGWGADGFSQAVATSATRKIFIDSIIDAIVKHDFDGIDLDWEYPGRTAGGLIVADPANDRRNFSLLLKELREAMDELDPSLLLTAAVPGGSTSLYEVPELNKYLDYLHLMTYDLIRSGFSSHHSALHLSANAIASASSAVSQYAQAGFDPSRMVIGAAFYGYIGSVNEPNTNGINLPIQLTPNRKITYTNIHQQYVNHPDFTLHYDNVAKAYWLYDGDTFISFDHPYALKDKVDYVVDNNLGGIMFWEYNGDQTGILLDAIYQAFQSRLES